MEVRRRRFRRRPLGPRIALACVVGFAAWMAGLIWFAGQLPRTPTSNVERTDAIVVLTGGSGRLEQGLELLAAQRADKLFVSGVYRGVDVRQLLELFQTSPNLECCIVLGYEADDTRGNARETRDWMRAQGFASLRLVTSAYHMPRSLLEFERTMPEIDIVRHPVFPKDYRPDGWWPWPASARLLLREYHGYLVALLRGPIVGGRL